MKQTIILRLLCADMDRDALKPILDALKEKGLQTADAKGSLKKREILLAALSEHFYADADKQNSLLEILSTGAENVLPLKLDESEIPDELMNALYARNIITATDRSPELIAERVLSAIPEKKSNLSKILIAGAAVLLVLAGLLIWRSSPREEPEPEPTPEPTPEEVISIPVPFGLTEEDLAEIRVVSIVGDQVEFYTSQDIGKLGKIPEWDQFAVRSMEDNQPHYYSRADGHEYPMTRYDDLRFLSLMPNLSYLYLSLADIPELPDLEKVTEVRLSDCQITDLGWLSASPVHHIDVLDSMGTVRDYSPLTACEKLDEVHIDLLGAEQTDLSDFAPPKLNRLWIDNGEKLQNELNLSALSSCSGLRECKLEFVPVTDLSFLSGAVGLQTLTLNRLSALWDISVLRNAKSLKNLEITYCPRVTDYSPIAGCTALESIHVQGDENPNALQDASFLADLPKLRDIGLYACNLNNMDFLEGIAQHQQTIRLGFAGDIRDYSGLSHIRRYDYLHINPRYHTGRGGDFAAVLPYIQDTLIDDLMLFDCSGVDLNALPDGIHYLSIRYGDLEDLSGLKPYSLRRLELWDCQYLKSLTGLENIPNLFQDKATVELSITGCPRLTDWSALDGTYSEDLKLIGTWQIPDFSKIRTNVLRLESIEGLTDLHCLDSLDPDSCGIFEFVGLDELYDLTPLRRLHGDKLTVPPQVADQAEDLVKEGVFREYTIAYPDGSWHPYEGRLELLSLDELETLPKALLRKVERLQIIGNELGGDRNGWIEEDWSTGKRVPVWFDPGTQEQTKVEQGSITDLGIFSELTGLRSLELYCQPLESLDGIQNFSSLERLRVSYCPNLTDASAVFALEDLQELDIGRNPIENIQGVQNLNRLQRLSISGTNVKDLSPLQSCDFSAAYENNGGVQLEIDGIPAEDFGALSNIRRLRDFCPNNLDANLWAPALENTEISNLFANSCFHDNEIFAAFIAAHPELEQLGIAWNRELTDLTPVLSLEHLQKLRVSRDMEPAMDAVRAANPGFEIEVEG